MNALRTRPETVVPIIVAFALVALFGIGRVLFPSTSSQYFRHDRGPDRALTAGPDDQCPSDRASIRARATHKGTTIVVRYTPDLPARSTLAMRIERPNGRAITTQTLTVQPGRTYQLDLPTEAVRAIGGVQVQFSTQVSTDPEKQPPRCTEISRPIRTSLFVDGS